MKIELIFQVENLLPNRYLAKVNLKKAKYFVNQGRKFLGGLFCGISIREMPFNGETIDQALHPTKVKIRYHITPYSLKWIRFIQTIKRFSGLYQDRTISRQPLLCHLTSDPCLDIVRLSK